MTVKELVRQAVLKFRVYNPMNLSSSLDQISPQEETLLSDWYLTLCVNGNSNFRHAALANSDNVLSSLAKFQQSVEAAGASPDSRNGVDGEPVSKSKLPFAINFESQLINPVRYSKRTGSQKAILQIISPGDNSHIRIMLHQKSYVAQVQTKQSVIRSNSPNLSPTLSSIFSAPNSAQPAGSNQLIRVVLYASPETTSADMESDEDEPFMNSIPIRMAKTLKVDAKEPVSSVIQRALKKFAVVEGKSLGELEEYDLFEAPGSPLQLPRTRAKTGPTSVASVGTRLPLVKAHPLPLAELFHSAQGCAMLPTFQLKRISLRQQQHQRQYQRPVASQPSPHHSQSFPGPHEPVDSAWADPPPQRLSSVYNPSTGKSYEIERFLTLSNALEGDSTRVSPSVGNRT
jgi:hypothetical protein